MSTKKGKKEDAKAGAKDILLPEGQALSGKALRVNDIIEFFKYNLDPTALQATIKMSVARANEGKGKVPIELIMGIGILLVCAGIAYLIISGAQSGGACQGNLAMCSSQLSSCQSQLSARVITSATTTTLPAGGPGVIIQ